MGRGSTTDKADGGSSFRRGSSDGNNLLPTHPGDDEDERIPVDSDDGVENRPGFYDED